MATATAVIACAGEGEHWTTDEENNIVCPVCGLTPKELGIRVRKMKSGKINPPVVPGHEIEVDGTAIKFVLVDGEFYLHNDACAGAKRDAAKEGSETSKPETLVAVDLRDAMLQLWSEQIEAQMREDDDEIGEDDEIDVYDVTDKQLNAGGYANSTHVHRCLAKTDGFATTKTVKNGSARKDSKHALATLLIEAMGATLNEIFASSKDSTDEDLAEYGKVTAGMDEETARQVAANWVHHFPADRERWLASGMVKPLRSDWKDEPQPKAADTDEDDTEEEDDEDAA